MRVAVLTISDSVAKGEREDLSGPAVVAACRGLGWEVTTASAISDDPAGIRQQLRDLADSGRVANRRQETELAGLYPGRAHLEIVEPRRQSSEPAHCRAGAGERHPRLRQFAA